MADAAWLNRSGRKRVCQRIDCPESMNMTGIYIVYRIDRCLVLLTIPSTEDLLLQALQFKI
jgi:hypothetical protein